MLAAVGLMALTAAEAPALTQFVIQGKWCGQASRYEFTPKRMKVHRYKDNVKATFVVLRYEFFDNIVKVTWRNYAGDETYTRFGNFDAAGMRMTQLTEEKAPNMPQREFRRCTR